MRNCRIYHRLGMVCLALAAATSCTPELTERTASRAVPSGYTPTAAAPDTTTAAQVRWQEFFADPYLKGLIDTALLNNQELNITRQEIELARQEVRARKGEYLPFVGLGGRAGADKVGHYTVQGRTEENTQIQEGRTTPELVPDFRVGLFASWEVDIWGRLRTARKAAVARYLASVEGRNFTTTNLIAEISRAYYELLALDNQLALVEQTIRVQTNALEVVRRQMMAAQVTGLAVRRFEAQVQHTRNLRFQLSQQITVAENELNYLLGRYPRPIARTPQALTDLAPPAVTAGLPAQLLQNRPDIRQAEQELAASHLDLRVARASFYPSLGLSAGVGSQAFALGLLTTVPQSLLYGIGADVAAPLVNRNGLKAGLYGANARQTQAALRYEQTLRNAYREVANQLANIQNLAGSYEAKSQEVAALNESVTISGTLFQSARADYMEVLLTQREALDARFDLVEVRLRQQQAVIDLYRALGGGWK